MIIMEITYSKKSCECSVYNDLDEKREKYNSKNIYAPKWYKNHINKL